MHPSTTITIQDVSPATAAEWLIHNTSNRPIRPARVRAMADDMTAGRWLMDGSPIRFNGDGTLLDGQHRLSAVQMSGVTVPMVVIFGIAHEAQAVMDGGAKRTASDVLQLNGVKNGTAVAAIARLAIAYQSGAFDRARKSAGLPEVSNSRALEFVELNPDLHPAAALAVRTARPTDCTPAIVGFTAWRLAQIDAAQAFQFWEDAAARVNLPAGDPVLAMTWKFAEARRSRQTLSHYMYLSAVFRTWNARRAGKPLLSLKMRSPKGGLIEIPVPR